MIPIPPDSDSTSTNSEPRRRSPGIRQHNKKPDPPLGRTDAWFMFYVVEACERVSCIDFVDDAAKLPRSARANIMNTLRQLKCPESWITPEQITALQRKLVAVMTGLGCELSFAEAFFMPYPEWVARHVMGIRRCSVLPTSASTQRQIVIERLESEARTAITNLIKAVQ